MHVVYELIEIIELIIPLILSVAFLTLYERKLLGGLQGRKGPMLAGAFGVLLPIADAVKLLFKEFVVPNRADISVYFLAPILTFLLSMLGWAVIPLNEWVIVSDLGLGVLYLFVISSLGVYGIIIAGWSSNSRYAFLGSLRSAAQMVSYEVSFGLILLSILISAGTLNVSQIVFSQSDIWYVVPYFPILGLFFISALAETNRTPFDLPEAEAELVAGYNVEYSSVGFALFFLGEYANMILMSALVSLFFLGGWNSLFTNSIGSFWIGVKTAGVLFMFILVRGVFPRYRYDQLMQLGWKVFLPISGSFVVFVSCILFAFDGFPLLNEFYIV